MNRMNTNSFWLGSMFLLGCAMAGIAGPLAVPSIKAGTSPQKWEQTCVPFFDKAAGTRAVQDINISEVNMPTGWNRVLTAYGEQGWELVTVLYTDKSDAIATACFKRPR